VDSGLYICDLSLDSNVSYPMGTMVEVRTWGQGAHPAVLVAMASTAAFRRSKRAALSSWACTFGGHAAARTMTLEVADTPMSERQAESLARVLPFTINLQLSVADPRLAAITKGTEIACLSGLRPFRASMGSRILIEARLTQRFFY
jgi:hypothetical protein